MTRSMMRRFLVTALFTAGLVGAALPAQAESMDGQSPWMIRLRGLAIIPDESSKISMIGGEVDVDNAYVPELDITYFLDEGLALELILATSKHEMGAKNTSSGDLDLGKVWVLPPTLLLQYHFDWGDFKPYVGAGVNYTIFYNDDQPAGFSIDYDNAVGFALQIGADFWHHGPWFANVDLKKLFLSTDATVNGAIKAEVDLDPWIVGFGIGYRF